MLTKRIGAGLLMLAGVLMATVVRKSFPDGAFGLSVPFADIGSFIAGTGFELWRAHRGDVLALAESFRDGEG